MLLFLTSHYQRICIFLVVALLPSHPRLDPVSTKNCRGYTHSKRSKSNRKSAARLLSVLFQGHTGQFASSRIQVVMVWPFRTLVGECPHVS
ncbi:hypothetical protein EDD17DRAFT_1578681 [Pisolithus thermaeus]|nr:hypothetical protein EDD17DRAFT_1578681 [Pisolithus thermaeus]